MKQENTFSFEEIKQAFDLVEKNIKNPKFLKYSKKELLSKAINHILKNRIDGIVLIRTKLFTLKNGKSYIDVRSYELNKAVKEKKNLTIIYDLTKESLSFLPNELTHKNFEPIGINKEKEHYCDFNEPDFNIKKGDKYILYSTLWKK